MQGELIFGVLGNRKIFFLQSEKVSLFNYPRKINGSFDQKIGYERSPKAQKKSV